MPTGVPAVAKRGPAKRVWKAVFATESEFDGFKELGYEVGKTLDNRRHVSDKACAYSSSSSAESSDQDPPTTEVELESDED